MPRTSAPVRSENTITVRSSMKRSFSPVPISNRSNAACVVNLAFDRRRGEPSTNGGSNRTLTLARLPTLRSETASDCDRQIELRRRLSFRGRRIQTNDLRRERGAQPESSLHLCVSPVILRAPYARFLAF